MKNIVNIINFIRGIEPREGRNINLIEPVQEQIRLLRENNLQGTFLIQYDAMLQKDCIQLMKKCKNFCEIGIWLEIVQPLVEKVGEVWHGRYPWDWHNDVGFLVGYEPAVRFKLLDEVMEKFHDVFGYYPKSVGAWHIDAKSLEYLYSKYKIEACCICRDQVGTDGYTMQGGYYNQAYFPSKKNIFCPANEMNHQIQVPVFRMLGSDAIYAYDFQVIDYDGLEKCPTLEPAHFGGVKEWCDWFYGETFDGTGLSFQYTQTGQENSFGWPRMREGLEYQIPLLKKLQDEGKLEVMTMNDSANWFVKNYKITPPSSYSVFNDFLKKNRSSIWYSCRHYRINLLFDQGVLRIRDMYVFDDQYEEKYLNRRCETHACEYRNLPVMDGTIYTNPQKQEVAGIYFASEEKIVWERFQYKETIDGIQITMNKGNDYAKLDLAEDKIKIESSIKNLRLEIILDEDCLYGAIIRDSFLNHNTDGTVLTYVTKMKQEEKQWLLEFDNRKYGIAMHKGSIHENSICAEDGKIEMGILKEKNIENE